MTMVPMWQTMARLVVATIIASTQRGVAAAVVSDIVPETEQEAMTADTPLLLAAWACVAVIVGLLLWRYADRQHAPYYVLAVTYVGWFFPSSIIILLPADLTSTLYYNCLAQADCETKPYFHVTDGFLKVAWRVIYWSSFVLTWSFIPFLTRYIDNGYFTVRQKAVKAIKKSGIYYASLGAVGLLGILYLLITRGMSRSDLLSLGMALSNAWGLLIGCMFMAYGLVTIPRKLWAKANHAHALRLLYFKAPKLHEDNEDAQKRLAAAVSAVESVNQQVPMHDPLRPFVQTILSHLPRDSPTPSPGESPLRASPTALPSSGQAARALPNRPDVRTLSKVHRDLLYAALMRDRYTQEWLDLCQQAWWLEDIVAGKRRGDQLVNAIRSKLHLTQITTQAREWWYVWVHPFFFRVVAITLGAFSLAIIWSESVFMFSKDLSLFALILHGNISYSMQQFVSTITVIYMCCCTYYTLLNLRFYSDYHFSSNQKTAGPSLIFAASYFCRLTFPLCYNYLFMVKASSFEKEPVYSKIMGSINLTFLFGDNWNNYVPTLVVVIAILTVTDAYGRLMKALGFDSYAVFSGANNSDDLYDVEDGEALLQTARQHMSRDATFSGLRGSQPIPLSNPPDGQGAYGSLQYHSDRI